MQPTEGKSKDPVPTPQGSTVRPLQGRKNSKLSCRSVGFTYGYSPFSPSGKTKWGRHCLLPLDLIWTKLGQTRRCFAPEAGNSGVQMQIFLPSSDNSFAPQARMANTVLAYVLENPVEMNARVSGMRLRT